MPSATEQSIEVGVPLATAYNQWTQFEEFPHFMDGVNEVVSWTPRTGTGLRNVERTVEHLKAA